MQNPEHKIPDWEMAVETEIVRRNLEECMKGDREPRPMVPAIYPSSTFVLQDSKEGEVLSGNKAKVLAWKLTLAANSYRRCTTLFNRKK